MSPHPSHVTCAPSSASERRRFPLIMVSTMINISSLHARFVEPEVVSEGREELRLGTCLAFWFCHLWHDLCLLCLIFLDLVVTGALTTTTCQENERHSKNKITGSATSSFACCHPSWPHQQYCFITNVYQPYTCTNWFPASSNSWSWPTLLKELKEFKEVKRIVSVFDPVMFDKVLSNSRREWKTRYQHNNKQSWPSIRLRQQTNNPTPSCDHRLPV